MADRRRTATLLIVSIILKRKKCKRRQRSIREKDWLNRRSSRSVYNELLQELRLEDPQHYRRYLRMDTATFENLLEKVTPYIKKKTTNMREPIPPEERLAVTLRYLATGESFCSLQYQYRISACTLTQIIPEVCAVIFQVLKDDFLKCPTSPEQWLQVAQSFKDRWQLPHCLGAIDGKHVKILHPAHSGSSFFNYKGFYSVVLMAVIDADYKFLFADVGCQGRISDGGVIKNTNFWTALVEDTLGLPDPQELPMSSDRSFHDCYSEQPMPYFFAGDDAFSLETHLMKPYGQKHLTEEKRVFNYRLSRARRLSENAFGILSSRFRVFLTTLCVKPDNAVKIILAAISLHNFLRSKVPGRYTPSDSIDIEKNNGEVEKGSWRHECESNLFEDLPNYKKGRQTLRAEAARDMLCQYVNGPGQIPWQWNVLV